MQLEHHLLVLQLHLHSRLHTWLHWIGQRQLQDEMRNIWVLGFGAAYIRGLKVTHDYLADKKIHFKMKIPYTENMKKTIVLDMTHII